MPSQTRAHPKVHICAGEDHVLVTAGLLPMDSQQRQHQSKGVEAACLEGGEGKKGVCVIVVKAHSATVSVWGRGVKNLVTGNRAEDAVHVDCLMP